MLTIISNKDKVLKVQFGKSQYIIEEEGAKFRVYLLVHQARYKNFYENRGLFDDRTEALKSLKSL